MLFNPHSNLAGQHAFLSASKYHWINYDDDKLDRVFMAHMASRRGTELHALAHELIRLGVKLPKSPKTLNLYVNDAIGFRMHSEQILYYSDNCFGTADTISFRRNPSMNRDELRIHDLKTGKNPCQPTQLKIYAAMFCLEYRYKPADMYIEVRIYQENEIAAYEVDPDEITHIMDRIVTADRRVAEARLEIEA